MPALTSTLVERICVAVASVLHTKNEMPFSTRLSVAYFIETSIGCSLSVQSFHQLTMQGRISSSLDCMDSFETIFFRPKLAS